MKKIVNGLEVDATAADLEQQAADAAAWAAVAAFRAIDRQIDALEARVTQRMLREAAAGIPPQNYLDICAQIATLRARRAAL